eukprot:jgi/Mesvir1/16122/Mv08407-RA.1
MSTWQRQGEVKVGGALEHEGTNEWGFRQQGTGQKKTPRRAKECKPCGPREEPWTSKDADAGSKGLVRNAEELDAASLTRAFAASIGTCAAKPRPGAWAGGGVPGAVGFGGAQKWGKRIRLENARRFDRRQRLCSQGQGTKSPTAREGSKGDAGAALRALEASTGPRGERIVVEHPVPGDPLVREHEILSTRFGIHSLHMRPDKGAVPKWRMGEIQKRRLLASEGKPQPIVYYQSPVDVIDDGSLARKLGVPEDEIQRIRQRPHGDATESLRPKWGRPPIHRRGRESQIALSDIPSWGWAPYGLRPHTWREVILKREQVKLVEPLPPHAQQLPPNQCPQNAEVNQLVAACRSPACVLQVVRAALGAGVALTKANCVFALRRMQETWPPMASDDGSHAPASEAEQKLDAVSVGPHTPLSPCGPLDSGALVGLLLQLQWLMDSYPQRFSRTDIEELVAVLGSLSLAVPAGSDILNIMRLRAEKLATATWQQL